jgi:hypothetical protein
MNNIEIYGSDVYRRTLLHVVDISYTHVNDYLKVCIPSNDSEGFYYIPFVDIPYDIWEYCYELIETNQDCWLICKYWISSTTLETKFKEFEFPPTLLEYDDEFWRIHD